LIPLIGRDALPRHLGGGGIDVKAKEEYPVRQGGGFLTQVVKTGDIGEETLIPDHTELPNLTDESA